jgi:hypothetical protein
MGKLLALPLVLVAAVLGAIVWIFRRKAREAQAADLATFDGHSLRLTAGEPTGEPVQIVAGPVSIGPMRFLLMDGKLFEWDPASANWQEMTDSEK